MAHDMPDIINCSVKNCVYNRQNQCHAYAITVGDEKPRCDTFYDSQDNGGKNLTTGKVGACKISDCVHNNAYECTAHGINVSLNNGSPDCATFKQL
ncbi:MAG: DUF1540 domain-containing protein [Fibrobacter sp.]|nr:DUF1540 domain-containing protein [Fibrobacter sp.]